MYDVLGRRVLHAGLTQIRETFKLSEYRVYFLMIIDGDTLKKSFKVIVQKWIEPPPSGHIDSHGMVNSVMLLPPHFLKRQ